MCLSHIVPSLSLFDLYSYVRSPILVCQACSQETRTGYNGKGLTLITPGDEGKRQGSGPCCPPQLSRAVLGWPYLGGQAPV